MKQHTKLAKPVKNVQDLACGKRPFSRKCPERDLTLNGTYGSVMRSRTYHWTHHHPERPVSEIHKSAPTVAEVSSILPAAQAAWTCPLCPAKLPE